MEAEADKDNTKMNETTEETETSSARPSPKFVIKRKDQAQEETITIDGKVYNKKEELKKLELLMNQVSNDLKLLNEMMGNSENNSSLLNVTEALAEFPIETYNDLIAFDSKLMEDSNYRIKVINRIKKETEKYGTLNKKVKEALNVILNRRLARTITWTGKTSRRGDVKLPFRRFRNIVKVFMSIDDYFAGKKAVNYAIQVYFHHIF